MQDVRIPLIKEWLANPSASNPDLNERAHKQLKRAVTHFFLSKEGRLYKKSLDGGPKLVVEKDQRMYLIKASHDNLGHRGFYATKNSGGRTLLVARDGVRYQLVC